MGLLNEPSWIRFIGDRGVRTLDDARAYIENGPVDMYHRLGFGLYMVERKEDGAPLGMCGLIKRKGLDDVDIGFAYRPAYWSKGYAFEAAAAVLQYAKNTLGLRRIVAITDPENASSRKLLEKLGFKFEKMIALAEGQSEIMLFGAEF